MKKNKCEGPATELFFQTSRLNIFIRIRASVTILWVINVCNRLQIIQILVRTSAHVDIGQIVLLYYTITSNALHHTFQVISNTSSHSGD